MFARANVQTYFNPEMTYQPMPSPVLLYFDYLEQFRFFSDGSVQPIDPETHFEWDKTSKYPRFLSGCCAYTVHQIIGDVIWPKNKRPHDLKFVDHIDGNTKNNAWNNLRLVTPSMNAINRRSKKRPIRGWDHETEEYLTKLNACLAKNNKPVYRSPKDARNKYVARFTNKKKRIELGAFDTPEEAHQAYLNGREQFIRDQLKETWTQYLNQ